MSALVFPILPFVFEMTIFVYWATVATYLYTWGRENCRILGALFFCLQIRADTKARL